MWHWGVVYFTVSKIFGYLLAEYLPIVWTNLSSQADVNVITGESSKEGFTLQDCLGGGFPTISTLAFILYKSFHMFLFKEGWKQALIQLFFSFLLCSATRAYSCHKPGWIALENNIFTFSLAHKDKLPTKVHHILARCIQTAVNLVLKFYISHWSQMKYSCYFFLYYFNIFMSYKPGHSESLVNVNFSICW